MIYLCCYLNVRQFDEVTPIGEVTPNLATLAKLILERCNALKM